MELQHKFNFKVPDSTIPSFKAGNRGESADLYYILRAQMIPERQKDWKDIADDLSKMSVERQVCIMCNPKLNVIEPLVQGKEMNWNGLVAG